MNQLRVLTLIALGVLGVTGPGNGQAPLAEHDRLINQLKTGTEIERWRAAGELGRLGPVAPQSVHTALLGAFKDKSVSVRYAARTALGNMGPKAVVELQKALTGNDNELRVGAAQTLGLIGRAAKDVIPELKGAIGDLIALGKAEKQGKALREAAMQALGHLGRQDGKDDTIRPALSEVLENDPSRDMCLAAVQALGSMGEQAVKNLIVVLTDQKFKEEGYDDVRRSAASALGRIGKTAGEAVTKLRHVLAEDPDGDVRAAAALALGLIGAEPRKAVSILLLKLKEDRDYSVRRNAASALGRVVIVKEAKVDVLKVEDVLKVVEALREAMNTQPDNVRRAAVIPSPVENRMMV
jgi:HEAT repeat protein